MNGERIKEMMHCLKSFIHSRHTMNNSGKSVFGMKHSLSHPTLGRKKFTSTRLKDDESIYIYTEKYIHHLLRQPMKGGEVGGSKQNYTSDNSNNTFINFRKELNVDRKFPKFIS